MAAKQQALRPLDMAGNAIDGTGAVSPNADNTYALGTDALRFSTVRGTVIKGNDFNDAAGAALVKAGANVTVTEGANGDFTVAASCSASSAEVDNGNSGTGTVTLDLSAGLKHKVTATGNFTLAVSNVTAGMVFSLVIKQDATGSRTVTWWTTIRWAGQTAPTLTTTASRWDSFTFKCDTAGGSPVFIGYVTGQNI